MRPATASSSVRVVRPSIQLAEVVDVLQVPITGGQDVGLRRRRAVVLLAERVELRVQLGVMAAVDDGHNVVDGLDVQTARREAPELRRAPVIQRRPRLVLEVVLRRVRLLALGLDVADLSYGEEEG